MNKDKLNHDVFEFLCQLASRRCMQLDKRPLAAVVSELAQDYPDAHEALKIAAGQANRRAVEAEQELILVCSCLRCSAVRSS